MPGEFADRLYQHLLDQFPADRDYKRGSLYAEGMPPLVAGLLGRTLDRWLEHELDSLDSRWFDFDDSGVRAARAELVVALGRTARIPRSAWSDTLRYAVGLVVRHLVIPARALTDAIFEGSFDPLPQDMVRARIHVFEPYSYLPEIADAYLAQKQPGTVTPKVLFELLQRIDRRVTQEYSVDDWVRVLGPLFELVRELPDQRGIPPQMAARFFRDKGQSAIADALENHQKPLDESTLREIILSVTDEPLSHPEEVIREEIPEPAPPLNPVVQPEENLDEEPESEMEFEEEYMEEVDSDASIYLPDDFDNSDELDIYDVPNELPVDDVTDLEDDVVETPQEISTDDERTESRGEGEALPLWKRYAVEPPTSSTSESAPVNNINGGEGIPLWQRFLSGLRGPSPSEEPEKGPLSENVPEVSNTPLLDDLERDVLGENAHKSRKQYVRELFRGDEAAYAAVLQRLGHSRTWSQASQIIAQDIFRKYEVDIYSDVAVSFTDAANRRFE